MAAAHFAHGAREALREDGEFILFRSRYCGRTITGGILDGPLALDNATSLEAAKIKHIESPVAGRANVPIVPDLEAGNMLAKSLTFLADADAAGIVLGARVPVILTGRADSVTIRLASCAVASLVAKARREALSRVVA